MSVESRLREHLSMGHEVEFVTYEKPGDYGDGYPPVDVIYCVDCDFEIAVSALRKDDEEALRELFDAPVISQEEMSILCDKYSPL